MYTVNEREDYFQYTITKVKAIEDVEGIIQLGSGQLVTVISIPISI